MTELRDSKTANVGPIAIEPELKEIIKKIAEVEPECYGNISAYVRKLIRADVLRRNVLTPAQILKFFLLEAAEHEQGGQ